MNVSNQDRLDEVSARVTHPDIIKHIAAFCDKLTPSQISLVSRALDREVIPVLFKHVALDFKKCPEILSIPPLRDQGDSKISRIRNDGIPVSTRLANALTYARVLEIRGHIGIPCPARHFTCGFPTQIVQALQGVHTIRCIRTFHVRHLGSSKATGIAGFCDEMEGKPCRLLNSLKDRHLITSRSTFRDHVAWNGRPLQHHGPPMNLLGIRHVLTLTGKSQIIVLGKALPHQFDFQFVMPKLVSKAPLTIILLGQWEALSVHSRLVQLDKVLSDVWEIVRQPDSIDVRLAYNEEVAELFLPRIAIFQSTLETCLRISGDALKTRFREKVKVVDLADIVEEEWVDAFRGEQSSKWV